MSLPSWLGAVLPPDTAIRWEQVGRVAPAGALLVGGTALAVHLQHRLSRDLDFFVPEPFDTDRLATALSRLAPFVVTFQDDRTLNGVLGHTKVQFLDASNQRFIEPPREVVGIRVAGLGDILATKLEVIQDRGEHRDYFDLKAIEQRSGRFVEEGLLLFTRHYQLHHPDRAIVEVVRGLGYHGDLDEDPSVPEPLSVTTSYWQARLPTLIASLDRTATVSRPAMPGRETSPSPTPAQEPGPARSIQVEGYTRADGTAVRGYSRRR